MKTKTIIGYIIVIVITVIVIKLWCCPKCSDNGGNNNGGNNKVGRDSCCIDDSIPAGYQLYTTSTTPTIDALLLSFSAVTDTSAKGAFIPKEIVEYYFCQDCDSLYAMFVIDPVTSTLTTMYVCNHQGLIQNISGGGTGNICFPRCP